MKFIKTQVPRLLAAFLFAGHASTVSAWDRTSSEEPFLLADRQRASIQLTQAQAHAARQRSQAESRLGTLTEEIAEAQRARETLQTELVTVVAKDDTLTAKAIQTEIATHEIQLAAAESEKHLAQKQVEEAERQRDAWAKRIGVLDLALRLQLHALLAKPSEIAERNKKIEDAQKDVDYQLAQVDKYQSRRASTLAQCEELRYQIENTTAPEPAATTAGDSSRRWQAAILEQSRQRLRLLKSLQDWLLWNKALEEHAWRNLSFARHTVTIMTACAELLERRELQQKATEAQESAGKAESAVGAIRKTVEAHLAEKKSAMLAAVAAAEQAIANLGQTSPNAGQDRIRADYELALAYRKRLEAEQECLKELIALQKAVAAFAREQADRAKSALETRTWQEAEQEQRFLRDNLRTSEQYVYSLRTLATQLASRIADLEVSIGATPYEPALIRSRLLLFARQSSTPGDPTLAEEFDRQMLSLVESMTGSKSGTDLPSTTTKINKRLEWLFLLAQYSFLTERLKISETWLANTRMALRSLDAVSARTLWNQSDARLHWTTLAEFGSLLSRVGSDARFALDLIRAQPLQDRDHALKGRTLWGLAVLLLLWLLALGAAFLATGQEALPSPRTFWFIHGAPAILTLLLGAWLLRAFLTDNLFTCFVGWLLLFGAGWLTIRMALLRCCPQRQYPSGTQLSGALIRFLRVLCLSGILAGAFWCLATRAELQWNLHALIGKGWLFILWLAAFRLALHPRLLGYFLLRSAHVQTIRVWGSLLALGCFACAALAAAIVLATFDNLGHMVLRTVTLSFAFLIITLVSVRAAGWLLTHSCRGLRAPTFWHRTLQALISAGCATLVGWLWWRLLHGVLLAPNAPSAIQRIVHGAIASLHFLLRVWRHEVTTGMTVSSILRGVLVFILSFWIAKRIRRLFLERVLAHTPMDEATRLTFAAILGYTTILLGFLVGLNVAGSSLQNLALLAGAITVGLGFGLQNVINNFVSSLLIHFARTIRVGDYIDVGGMRGTVREIGLRTTIIQTDDGVTVLVPNGAFVTANITNWTYPDPRTRLHLPLTVLRQADLALVTQTLVQTAAAHELILKNPAPSVEVRSVTADKIALELLAWTEKPERIPLVLGELNLALDKALRAQSWIA